MLVNHMADNLPNQGHTLDPSFTSLMINVSRLHYRLLYGTAARLEIPLGAPPLLLWLNKHDGCRHKDLASSCYLEPATVTSALLTMEKEGLISRQADETDRRSVRIWLTDKGRDALRRINKVHQELEKICLAEFSDEEKIQLRTLLTRVSQNMAGAAGCHHSKGKCGC